MSAVERAAARFRSVFAGSASATPLELFRIGLGVLVLLRTTDWLRPWVHLSHYAWTSGVEFSPAAENVTPPRLHSPLLYFLPELSDGATTVLVVARTALALLLVSGVRTRWTALALFIVGYGLMAEDRHRYFHHTHLLWLSCLWLAVIDFPERFRAARPFRPLREVDAPRWSLQLLRAQCLVVYAAASLAKMRASWLSGRSFAQIESAGLLGGPMWERAVAILGLRGLAVSVAIWEGLIVVCLAMPRTRAAGVALGLALHVGLASCMVTATFGAQMALYLMLFLPWRERRADAFAAA